MMNAWMAQLARANETGEPTGAIMISGNCVELLRVFDIHPIFPEVTALQNAIRHQSLPLILKAEEVGYSSDNCAYVKADMGLFLSGGMGPGTKMPYPTVTLCNYVGCNVYVKWFEHLAAATGSELFMLGVPFLDGGGYVGVGLPPRSGPPLGVHRRADAHGESHQPVHRHPLRPDQALRGGVEGRLPRDPLQQELPALP